MKLKKVILKPLKWFLYLHLGFIGITLLLCVLYNFVNPPYTPFMLYRRVIDGYPYHKHQYISLERIPARVRMNLLQIEDDTFYQHHGFDFKSIQKAWDDNERRGKIRKGGSTISQQIARTLFLTSHRNWVRKYLETWITVEMELVMSKNRILELYFNYVEWGKGIWGMETASQFYYGKGVDQISLEQARKLLAIIASPIKYTPDNFMQRRALRIRYEVLCRGELPQVEMPELPPPAPETESGAPEEAPTEETVPDSTNGQ
jgi:monofunctional biosynthetic peptidoglycan transglycosylase